MDSMCEVINIESPEFSRASRKTFKEKNCNVLEKMEVNIDIHHFNNGVIFNLALRNICFSFYATEEVLFTNTLREISKCLIETKHLP